MWIVSKGKLGIFGPDAVCILPTGSSKPPLANPTLTRGSSYLGSGSPMAIVSPGESVGEFMLISDQSNIDDDNNTQKLGCAALEETEVYFLSRTVFEQFTRKYPHALIDFVRSAIARQWRVASYVLEHFLELPPDSRQQIQGPVESAKLDFNEIQLAKSENNIIDRKDNAVPSKTANTVNPTNTNTNTNNQSSLAIPAAFARFKGIKLLSLATDDILFNVNEEAESLYVINTGALQAYNSLNEPCAIIPSGCIVGGISFFGGTVRGETVRATEDTTVYEYTRPTIEQLICEEPLLLLPIVRAVARQLAPVCQQFFELGLDTRWYRSGHVIFRQGEEADAVYLTISGRIRMVAHPDSVAGAEHNYTGTGANAAAVSTNSNQLNNNPNAATTNETNNNNNPPASECNSKPMSQQTEQYIFEVGRGETFGEQCDFFEDSSLDSTNTGSDRVYRPYTAVCIRDTEAVRISSVSFLNLFEKNPRAMLRFSRSLTKRLNQLASKARVSNNRQKQSETNIATVAIVHIGSNNSTVDNRHVVREFGLRLMSELTTYGPVLWVNTETIAKELGQITADNLHEFVHRSKTARWLSEQEESNRFIFFEADELVQNGDIINRNNTNSSIINNSDNKDKNGDLSLLLRTLSRPANTSLVTPTSALNKNTNLISQSTSVLPTHTPKALGSVSYGNNSMINPTNLPLASPNNTNLIRKRRSVSAWTKMCIEQADCILLVGSAEADDASVSNLEHKLLWKTTNNESDSNSNNNTNNNNNGDNGDAYDSDDEDDIIYAFEDIDRVDVAVARHKDLVLLHPSSLASSYPTNTSRWLTKRQCRSHHHVRREVREDYARLARFLAGESIGVVLGGGGARGLAHLGVLRALQEYNIPIDYIVGTSQGAFMAALYARHLSIDSMIEPLNKFCGTLTTWGLLQDLTLPILSYFSGKRFSSLIRRCLGEDTQIEDLWLRYFCVTTNVRRSDMNIHRFGSLWKYVRASMTVLGFLPPILDDNLDLLVDGGYVNNLPVDILSSAGVNVIIAVDVEDKDMSGFEGLYQYGDGISGWWLLWQKIVGTSKLPDFTQILGWLACLNHSRQLRNATQNHIIDLYIRPGIEKYGLLDYDKREELVKIGYEAGIKAIKEWKNKLFRQAQVHQSKIEQVKLTQDLLGQQDNMQDLDENEPQLKVNNSVPALNHKLSNSALKPAIKSSSLLNKKLSVNFANTMKPLQFNYNTTESNDTNTNSNTSGELIINSALDKVAMTRSKSAPDINQPLDEKHNEANNNNTNNNNNDNENTVSSSLDTSGSASSEQSPRLTRAMSSDVNNNNTNKIGQKYVSPTSANLNRSRLILPSSSGHITRNPSMVMLKQAANHNNRKSILPSLTASSSQDKINKLFNNANLHDINKLQAEFRIKGMNNLNLPNSRSQSAQAINNQIDNINNTNSNTADIIHSAGILRTYNLSPLPDQSPSRNSNNDD
jgi:predicted acylesterase/phospholipase RssA/CRP-like cAMP-binding protein